MSWRIGGRVGPERIADWTPDEKARVYSQLVRWAPAQLVDIVHESAFAEFSPEYRAALSERLVYKSDAEFSPDLTSPMLLAVRFRDRIEARDPLTLEGWISFVADRFFDDVRLQTYLAAVVRNPAVLDPPQFALTWIWSLRVPWSSLRYDPVLRRWWFPEDFLDSDGTVSISQGASGLSPPSPWSVLESP
jgi:hypothetical protein